MRLERLLGSAVRDRDGRMVGRLEEFSAEREAEHWVVAEFHIGPAGLFERLAVRHFGWMPGPAPHGYVARWDQIDIADPDHPRLVCDVSGLKAIKGP